MTRADRHQFRAAHAERAIGHGPRRQYQPGGMDQRLELRDQQSVSRNAVDDPDNAVAGIFRNNGIYPIDRQADDIGQYWRTHDFPSPHKVRETLDALSGSRHNRKKWKSHPYFAGAPIHKGTRIHAEIEPIQSAITVPHLGEHRNRA